MAQGNISFETIKRLTSEVAPKHLEGDWILLGSCAAFYVGVCRNTGDIDIANLSADESSTNKDQNMLGDMAEDLGLAFGEVNMAAGYFFGKMADAKNMIVKIVDLPRGALFRANATLLVAMKMSRLTPLDLADAVTILASAPREEIDRSYLLEALEGVEFEPMSAKDERLSKLKKIIVALSD